MMASLAAPAEPAALSRAGRLVILLAAFLGWMFAGTQMAITPLIAGSATIDMLRVPAEAGSWVNPSQAVVGEWFARYNASFLLGAAAGGVVFGWLGDRAGRARAMALSILCYCVMSAVSYFAQTPQQLVVLRFIGCLGIGGMWPNGIALVSEAWPEVSRPALAGLIGTAANVGNVLMGLVGCNFKITPDSWRWVMLLGAAPVVVGLWSWVVVPESPRWRAGCAASMAQSTSPVQEVFRPPLLFWTLLGIALGTIPLLGGWGSGNWLVPWADKVGALTDPHLKAWTQVQRSAGGAISSLLGGWLADLMGRRKSYFLISATSLAVSAYIFRWLEPTHPQFAWMAFLLGFVSGFYFGWLPLCLPELFPTRVRSTGAGVTFNFGRVAAAAGVLGGGTLMRLYDGDYGRVGAITSLVYALGMVLVWFMPKSASGRLKD